MGAVTGWENLAIETGAFPPRFPTIWRLDSERAALITRIQGRSHGYVEQWRYRGYRTDCQFEFEAKGLIDKLKSLGKDPECGYMLLVTDSISLAVHQNGRRTYASSVGLDGDVLRACEPLDRFVVTHDVGAVELGRVLEALRLMESQL